jgi:hypothetical protein
MEIFEKAETKRTAIGADETNIQIFVTVDPADGSKTWQGVARVTLEDGTEAMGQAKLTEALTLEERTTFKALANKLRNKGLQKAGWIEK